MSVKLERNIFGYLAILLSWSFSIYFLIWFAQSIADVPSITISQLFSPFCLLILFSLPGIILTFEVLRQYSTELTDLGLKRNFLGTSKTVLWDEVQDARIKFYTLTLQTDKKEYVINLLLYKHPEKVVEFVIKKCKL